MTATLNMFDTVRRWFSTAEREARLQQHLGKLRQQTPIPVFWLFGKTQSGKTSIIKFLTGANDAEIGHGFRPCTRFSRQYQFPSAEAPLLNFLDTRGLDEPDYDPELDLGQFNTQAHVVVVTVKALDHAQENVLKHLRVLRKAQPLRPIMLVLTCLHDAYPQQQHPESYPFTVDWCRGQANAPLPEVPSDLLRSIAEHRRRFAGLHDVAVPVDLTRPEDGFKEPNFGSEMLHQMLLDLLPAAYRQSLLTLDIAMRSLEEFYARQALPYILGYASLATTAGAIPVPWIDLLILPGIQTRMIFHLAKLYGQPLSGARFLELASTLGLGMVLRQASREVMKLIPYVGSVAGGALAGTSTFALGKAFCYYYRSVHQGHVPKPDDLRRYYREQLVLAEKNWSLFRGARPETGPREQP